MVVSRLQRDCASPEVHNISRRLLAVPGFMLVVAALYWGRAILIPLTLATLLAFLLSPVVTGLRRWGFGRGVAVLLVVTLLVAGLSGAGYVLGAQVAALLDDVPRHTARIKARIAEFRPQRGGSKLDRARGAIDEVVGELEKVDRASRPAAGPPPQPVVVRDDRGVVRRVSDAIGLLGPAGLVVALVVFMLVERQELRDRFIRLIGYGRLTVTTKAIDDATQRISKYLLTQAMVNAAMGLAFGLGVLALGVPYALLWGVLLALARYVPFVGVWAAVVLPVGLSLALSDGWLQPALVLALFLAIEILVNTLVEPVLYSHHVGVSKVALIVAIAFWAWLWGAIGLILATPLTVCLVVLAKYAPALDFVSLLIGDEPALPASAGFYQRLLARDEDEAEDIVEARLAAGPPEMAWDGVVLPALVQARRDLVHGRLDAEDERFILASMKALIGETRTRSGAAAEPPAPVTRPLTILGCPARDEGDAVALEMFRQLASPALFGVEVVPTGLLSSELVARVTEEQPPLIVLAALPPGGLARTRYLLKRLRACCPATRILVGRWGAVEDTAEQRRGLVEAGADEVADTLTATRDQLLALSPVLGVSGERSVVAPRLQPSHVTEVG